ncbi:MAG: hypothetical protein GY864_02790 [Desulfobacterales bacterium]|nr:hypothetical protein [Desulfobacterales bacterium]
MKRQTKQYVPGILVMILFLCISCGQSLRETVSPVVPSPVDGRFKRAVIVPFADYTPASSPYDDWRWRRNLLVLEALQDEFFRVGLIPAVEEDVVKYLLDKGIIQESGKVSGETALLQEEIKEGWSDEMKKEFQDVIIQNMASQTKDGYRAARKPLALDNQTLMDLGSRFNADYIVRGRILEFSVDREDTFDPFKIGLLPFVFNSGQRLIFGIAESDTYETIDKTVLGAALGGALGSGADTPFDELDSSYRRWNTMVWGPVGAGLAYLADKGGKVPRATVQLRVMVQDAGTGEIIWLNRAQAAISPVTSFAEHNERLIFQNAVREAVISLVDNFVATLASGSVATIDKEGLTISQKSDEESLVNNAKAGIAADEAEASARQAEDAAVEARSASGEAARAAREAEEASTRVEEMLEKIDAK